ncbi:PqqD family protein [Sphingomonas sp.]|uniref:PqqD family protein n=1 Tax=Sphingomonas sp. TaxID=28214 RepID=UPI001B219556|nr:PqqD family protein [Sphingomonas sp.]MBO9712259.1 PqqD family protein [Sphingomonas sp.]
MRGKEAEQMIVRRGAGLIEAEVDGEMVALHVDNGTCYSFNGTATRIWQLIAEPRSLATICAALVEEYEVDPAECEADVRVMLDDLATDGIVEFG